MTDDEITAACKKHGAKAVSDAAYAAMGGDYKPLSGLGISCIGLAPLYRITSLTHQLMTPDEQADNLAQAAVGLAKIKPID